MSPQTILLVVLAAVAFGLTARLFSLSIRTIKRFYAHRFRNYLIAALVGSLVLLGAYAIFDAWSYGGLSEWMVSSAFEGACSPIDPIAKLAFTALTLGAGFQGGEVTPLFGIGASMGSVFGQAVGFDPSLPAALGMIAVFGSALNVPITTIMLGIDLFGGRAAGYFVIVSFVSYLVAGHRGVYPAQRIVTPKRRSLAGDERLTVDQAIQRHREQVDQGAPRDATGTVAEADSAAAATATATEDWMNARTNLGKTMIIVNPTAQSGAAATAAQRVQRFLSMYMHDDRAFDLVNTTHPRHAAQIASQATGYNTVLALGGDGWCTRPPAALWRSNPHRAPAWACFPWVRATTTRARSAWTRTGRGPQLALPRVQAHHGRGPHRLRRRGGPRHRLLCADLLLRAGRRHRNRHLRAAQVHRPFGDALYLASGLNVFGIGYRRFPLRVKFEDQACRSWNPSSWLSR